MIESSEKSSGPSPSSLSRSSSTSHEEAGGRVPEPPNSTSSGFSARSSLGARLPVAQTIASARFDLPEPFGPTTTATPGSSRSSTGSGNDLKPRRRSVRRCTSGSYRPPRMPLAFDRVWTAGGSVLAAPARGCCLTAGRLDRRSQGPPRGCRVPQERRWRGKGCSSARVLTSFRFGRSRT